MRTLTDTFWDFARRPNLCQIWIPLHNNGRAPLVSIWINSALRGSNRARERKQLRMFLEGQEKAFMGRFDAEHLNCILPHHN